ncbi:MULTISPECIES: DNA polymerase IV [Metallosphaera]|uniref:DNA polymerase IV n=1 Tax=Metallosphaera TaxID=41980 RepID=UPI001F06D2F2|nr:DNA polymerase IV [Metallosphaera sedula]MCH1771594.1 DNA polymerase IV [Metallosphaera sedula]MCP6728193.1 DNA polymerase IV [Metallosphaera sedula]BBL46607.1 DNA polymerase IV [Metallosphaera sedula]
MIVLFVDFDYFFAQVEEILNPSLKGKPVVVCVYSGRTKDSGAVATSNYEARKLGIKAGMPIIKAKEIGKDAIFLPMRKEVYQQVSRRVMNIISGYGDKLEIASIDEAYLDITRRVKDFDEAKELARRLKAEVLEKERLRVTVGIGPNKVVAKIIADMNKPDGLGIIYPEEVKDFLHNLDISKVPGVGKITEEILRKAGINRLGDVVNKSGELVNLVGKSKANYLLSLANNTYHDPVESREITHRGRYVTLPENTRDLNRILPSLKRSIEEAYSKVDGIPMEIYVVAIMEDLDIMSKGKSFKFGVSQDRALSVAQELLNKILESDKRKLRRVGVRLGKITKSSTLEDFLH